jgi:hypothetical protein
MWVKFTLLISLCHKVFEYGQLQLEAKTKKEKQQ